MAGVNALMGHLQQALTLFPPVSQEFKTLNESLMKMVKVFGGGGADAHGLGAMAKSMLAQKATGGAGGRATGMPLGPGGPPGGGMGGGPTGAAGTPFSM